MSREETAAVEVQPAAPPSGRRYVYNGEPAADAPVQHGNRPVQRRKRSPFSIILVLFAVSTLIVFYIWNKIAVNRLAIELSDLQARYQKITSMDELLRSQINKKTSLERIGKIATTQLGLIYPQEQPTWFIVDMDRLPERR